MKVTIKKGTGAKGMIDRTKVHVLTVWVDLTKEEKKAIASSGLRHILLRIDPEDELNKSVVPVQIGWFIKDSGPYQIKYQSAFEANSAGVEFKGNIEIVASAIKDYVSGEITGEESFEL